MSGFVGGPFPPDGSGLNGKVKSRRGKRQRLTSLTDEIREAQQRDGFIASGELRDPDMLTDGERRQMSDWLDQYIQEQGAAIDAKLPVDLVRVEDWQADADIAAGTRGLTASEHNALRREGERVIDQTDQRGFRALQREAEKRQAAIGEAHEAVQRQGELLDGMWGQFQADHPDLASLSPEIVADYARRHATDLSYGPNDFYNDDGSIDPAGLKGFTDGTAESLRVAGYGKGAGRQAETLKSDSTAELIRLRNEQEGF